MRFKHSLLTALAGIPLALMVGCSDSPEPAKQAKAEAPAQQSSIRLNQNQGQVIESSNAGGYSYIQVDQNGKKFWLAGNQVNVTQGDIVTWGQAQLMSNFSSKALNRTFDEIYFVSSIQADHSVAAQQAPAQRASAPLPNQGTVIAVQNSGGYTYVQVRSGGGEQWVAGPMTQLSEGQTIEWSGAAMMKDFTSKSLNRTFDQILFVSQIRTLSANARAAAAPAANQGQVISAQNAGGYTYLQVNTGAGEKWVAAPMMSIKAGDTVSWSGAAPMRNFTSNSLNKTFDEILFAGSVQKLN